MKKYWPSHEIFLFSLILAAAILLFWWRVWIPTPQDRMHFSDDIFVKDYPARMGLQRILLSGFLPLWDPYQFGGWPGIANCEAGFFYPPNWLLLPFAASPPAAFTATEWLVLLHFFLAGLGAYRLARFMGLSPLGAGMTAAAYTFCGFHCAHKKHVNMLFTLVWLPWLLLQVERWIQDRAPLRLLKLSFLLALAYSAGHPQASLYTTLFVGARMLHAAISRTSEEAVTFPAIACRLAVIFGVAFFSFALTAIQWLPTAELIQQGERASVDAFRSSSEYSLPPYELLDAFLPEVFHYWTQVEVFYWGIVPFLLVLFAVTAAPLDSTNRFLLTASVLSILFSLGENFFLYDLSYLLVPGVAWVRAPSRWIYFASLPIALMAGRGADLLSQPNLLFDRERMAGYYRALLLIAALLAAILLLLVIGMQSETSVQAMKAIASQLPSPEFYDEEWRRFISGLFSLVLFGGSFLLLLHLAKLKKISPRTIAVLAIALAWIDLGTHYRLLDLQEGPGGYRIDTEVKRLQESSWNLRTKVFFHAGGDRTLYHGAAQNFRELDGQSPLTPRLHLELREDTALLIPDKPNYALYKLLGAGAILTDAGALMPRVSRETNRLYFTNEPSVRARVLYDAFQADLPVQRALLKLQSFPFDQVVLTNAAPESYEAITAKKKIFPKPFLLASGSAKAVQAGAHLVIGGVDHFADIEDVSKGYYFAVADPYTGDVEKTAAFDLMLSLNDPSRREHRRMMDFVAAIPDGKIVMAAVGDNATNMLLPEGLAALRTIGASVDVRYQYQYAHAIVGRKGAPIGSALEILSPTEAVALQTNEHFFVKGQTAGRPSMQWETAAQYAQDWERLFENLRQDRLPAQYYLMEDGSERTMPKSIQIVSAPKTLGIKDRASILVGGRETALNRTGYNLAVLNPNTFQVEESAVFNLLADYAADATNYVKNPPEENLRMQAFIHSVTEGYFLLGAICDEAIDLMQLPTLAALRDIGSRLDYDAADPDKRKRISHAFACIKGATLFVEDYHQNQESTVFLFPRYPGGPALMPSDRNDEENIAIPSDPVSEIVSDATRIQTFPEPAPGRKWYLEEQGPNRLRISGFTPEKGFLFIGEMSYPGWKAKVDGAPQPIERCNYYFRGLPVEAGMRVVEMDYSPVSFQAGMQITVIAFLTAAALWILTIRKIF
ncbi:MAG: interleukin-like EMT inducer domain-containing protein [Candidatus Omnitrophota bacterium]